MAARERTVDLVIRARDQYKTVLDNLKKQYDEIAAKGRAASLALIVDKREDLARRTAELRKLGNELRTVSADSDTGRQRWAELTVQIHKVRVAARELKGDIDGLRQAQARVNGTNQSSFASFIKHAEALDVTAAKEARLRREIEATSVAMAAAQARAQQHFTAQKTSTGTSNLTFGRQAASEVRDYQAQIQGLNAELNRLAGTQKSSFLAFSQKATAMQAATVATKGEQAAAALAAAQLVKLDTAAKGVTASQSRAKTAVDATTAALNRQSRGGSGRARSNAKGEDQDIEIWGLKPWQLTNLGYQVNDVVSGLAMGQAPVQILAQQAGQFAQIWPQVMVGLARSIPVIAGVSAVLAPFVAALVEVNARANALDDFTKRLSTMADGARYSAEALTEVTREFGDIEPLLRAGIGQDQIQSYYDLAEAMSRFNGDDVSQNAERLAMAYKGGAAGVRELDEELNFLTADQYKQILALEKSGDKTAAMTVAQKALEARFEAFSDKADGPWSQAAENLGNAWDDAIDFLSTSAPVNATIGVFNALGRAVNFVANNLAKLAALLPDAKVSVGSMTVDQTRAEITRLENQIKQQQDYIAQLERDQNNGLPVSSGAVGAAQDALNAALEARDELLDALTKKTEALKQHEAGITEETEAQQKNRIDLNAKVEEQLKALRLEAELATKTNREQFIKNELLKAENDAKERSLKLSEKQLEVIRQQAGATFDARDQEKYLTGSGISGYADRVSAVESNNDPTAKNSLSSATGLGQFLKDTWIELFEKYFPDRAESLTKEAMLALRKDGELSRKMIELYARENAKVLQQAGVAVNDAALYLAHFLGPNGAVKVLTAAPNTPVSSLLGADQIAANPTVLGGGKTAGDVTAWATGKMSASQEEVNLALKLKEIDAERLKKSEEYLADYKQRIANQEFELGLISKSAREAAIAKAVREEELRAKKAGVELTNEELDKVRELAAVEFDRANAETLVNQLLERRSALLETLEIAQRVGDLTKVTQTVAEIQQTEIALGEAIDKAILFWEAIGGEQASAAILKLQNMRGVIGQMTQEMESKFLPSAEELNESIADAGANAFDAMAQAIANGENAFQAFKNAVMQGLAQILVELGRAIIKQALFNALASAFSGGTATPGGGVGGFMSTALGAIFHDGGIIGAQAPMRMVNPAVFNGAQRYHGGGIIGGLRSNERPIIAEVGEEMLTADDPRHSRNGGAASAPVNLKVVNVIDPADVLEAGLATTAGERVLINHVSRRSGKFNAALSE